MGSEWMWECPTSAIASGVWTAVDLFWLCYTRSPGLAGWTIQRTGYPGPGTPLQQDNLTMWSFAVIENSFYALQADLQSEREHARGLQQLHRQVLAEGNR